MTEIEAYLQEMEVPPRYSQIMANTASSDVVWLSEKEIDALYDVPSIME